MQKIIVVLILVVLVLSLSGCRKRVSQSAVNTADVQRQIKDDAQQELDKMKDILRPAPKEKIDNRSNETMTAKDDSAKASKPKDSGDGKGKDKNADPDSNGKEVETSGGDGGGKDPGSGGQGSEEKPEPSSESLYKAKLVRTVGKLYPCQRYKAYIESESEGKTVNRTSGLHEVADQAGCYNVAEMLGGDSLNIDEAWISEQKPDAIIKYVGPSILGKGVDNTSAAQNLRRSILDRQGWGSVPAVSNRRVVLVSNQLLRTSKGILVTEFYLAKAMYPDLFVGVDVDKIRDELMGEGYEGIYVYK